MTTHSATRKLNQAADLLEEAANNLQDVRPFAAQVLRQIVRSITQKSFRGRDQVFDLAIPDSHSTFSNELGGFSRYDGSGPYQLLSRPTDL